MDQAPHRSVAVVRSVLLLPGLALALLLFLSAIGNLIYVPFVGEEMPAILDSICSCMCAPSVLSLMLTPVALPLAALAGRVPWWAFATGVLWLAVSVGDLLSVIGCEAPGNPWDGPYGTLLRQGIDTTLGILAVLAGAGLLLGALRHVRYWRSVGEAGQSESGRDDDDQTQAGDPR